MKVSWKSCYSVLLALCGMALVAMSKVSHADWKWNLQEPVTPVAREIFWLHGVIFWICVVIFVAVFGVMFYSIYKHRRSVGHQAEQFHENTTVEVIWTVIPLLILVVMAYPATKTVLRMKDTSQADVTIKVTGYQWKWGYDYLQDGVAFYSNLATPPSQIQEQQAKSDNYLLEVDHPLVVPVGKKIRLLLTANDVIHAWYVPAFGVKQATIPGFIRDTWFKAEKEGIYRGQCAELCGKEHGFMPIVVEVVAEDKYQNWLAEQKKQMLAQADDPSKTYTKEELISRGAKVFAANCVACHQATGKGIPGSFPALDGSSVVLGPQGEQVKVLLNGRSGTAMASFKQLSDVELAAVITYTRNSWSNQTGQTIQPTDIKMQR